MGCLTGNKPFHFGADLDHDPDPRILTEFLSLSYRDNCKTVAGSAAEVCALRVFPVKVIDREKM